MIFMQLQLTKFKPYAASKQEKDREKINEDEKKSDEFDILAVVLSRLQTGVSSDFLSRGK